jgi:tetratricopeptide (TPR) repeat protein
MIKLILPIFLLTLLILLGGESFSKENIPLIKTDTLIVYPKKRYISRKQFDEYNNCSTKKYLGNISDVEFASCIKPLALKGYAEAALKMSELYTEGKGVPADAQLATEWLMKAAMAGNSKAQYELGLLEQQAKNIEMAIHWYRQAANKRNPDAISALSLLYYFGEGVPKNYREAFLLMKTAVELGLIKYAGLVGVSCEEGTGTTKDTTQALAWYYVCSTKDPECIKHKEDLENKLTKQKILKAQKIAAAIQKKINNNTGLIGIANEMANEVWIEDHNQHELATSDQPKIVDLNLVQPSRKPPSFNINDVAVIIGIEKYRSAPTTQFATNDAKMIRDYFRVMGIPERNIEFLTDERATYSDIRKVIETKLPNLVKPDSRVIVYYAGHGAPNPSDGTAYLVPYDGDPVYLHDTSYPLERMYEKLSMLPAKEVLVIMDACFSGTGGRSVLPPGARSLVARPKIQPANRLIVLASTQDNQITTTLPEQQQGLFTYFFLRALKEGKKDITEVYEYLKPLVEDEAKRQNVDQTPTISPSLENLKGRFVFAR